jgi:hypothetical protein
VLAGLAPEAVLVDETLALEQGEPPAHALPLAPGGLQIVADVGVEIARELARRGGAVAAHRLPLAQSRVDRLDVLEEVDAEAHAPIRAVLQHSLADLLRGRPVASYIRPGS